MRKKQREKIKLDQQNDKVSFFTGMTVAAAWLEK